MKYIFILYLLDVIEVVIFFYKVGQIFKIVNLILVILETDLFWFR
jgi:hypothetical protein